MKKLSIILFLSALIVIFTAVRLSNADKTPTVPTEKEILTELTRNFDVLLKDAKDCNGVALDETDRTIGDYISGFWSFHASEQGKNWIEVKAARQKDGSYFSTVMLYRKDGEENWGWGVSFVLDANKKLKRDSFSCRGGG